MMLHCLLTGAVVHCQTVVSAATEADWVRWIGVVVGR
jgi:hypothetical protein